MRLRTGLFKPKKYVGQNCWFFCQIELLEFLFLRRQKNRVFKKSIRKVGEGKVHQKIEWDRNPTDP